MFSLRSGAWRTAAFAQRPAYTRRGRARDAAGSLNRGSGFLYPSRPIHGRKGLYPSTRTITGAGRGRLPVQGATASAAGQSRRPPPSGRSGYYTENAVQRLALRHPGANQLSGRSANFSFPLVDLAANQSFTQPLLEVASIILGKPRITCFCPSLSWAPLHLTTSASFFSPLVR